MDEEYADLFVYVFRINLNDADPSKPVTVRLEYQDSSEGSWNDCPERGDTVRTLTWSGTGSSWEGELAYDILDLDLGNALGWLWQTRIVCSYTLTDGTAGTVLSTDIGELYAYKGDYAEGVSAELRNGVLTATYKVDRTLVLDTSPEKLEVVDVTLWTGDGYFDWWDITDKATISPVASDGTITVTYTLDGEPVTPGKECRLSMQLLYNDKDGAITDWGSWADATFEIPRTPPTVVLDPEVRGPEPEGFFYPTLFFDMTLNDLKGGTAVGRIYVDTGNGFSQVEGDVDDEFFTATVVYDPEEETGDVWSNFLCTLLEEPENGGTAGRAKLVFDIVYPDGETDVIETESLPIHQGNFARINYRYGQGGWDVGERYDAGAETPLYTMSFDLILDDTLVEPERVEPYSDELWLENPWTNYYNAETQHYTAGDGTSHMLYTYVSDSPFPDGEYWFTPSPEYQEDEYNSWVPYDFYLHFVKSSSIPYEEPALHAVSADWDFAGRVLTYSYQLDLHSADAVTVTAQWMDSDQETVISELDTRLQDSSGLKTGSYDVTSSFETEFVYDTYLLLTGTYERGGERVTVSDILPFEAYSLTGYADAATDNGQPFLDYTCSLSLYPSASSVGHEFEVLSMTADWYLLRGNEQIETKPVLDGAEELVTVSAEGNTYVFQYAGAFVLPEAYENTVSYYFYITISLRDLTTGKIYLSQSDPIMLYGESP